MPESKNSKNAYVCNKLHFVVTQHADDGVTPMFISCLECGGMATSRMGKVDPSIPATHEWYKPTNAEVAQEAERLAKEFNQNAQDVFPRVNEHTSKGGLLLRKIDTKTPTTV